MKFKSNNQASVSIQATHGFATLLSELLKTNTQVKAFVVPICAKYHDCEVKNGRWQMWMNVETQNK